MVLKNVMGAGKTRQHSHHNFIFWMIIEHLASNGNTV